MNIVVLNFLISNIRMIHEKKGISFLNFRGETIDF